MNLEQFRETLLSTAEQYEFQASKLRKAAEMLGVTKEVDEAVSTFAKTYTGQEGEGWKKHCKQCRKEFVPNPRTGNKQKYCSTRCRAAANYKYVRKTKKGQQRHMSIAGRRKVAAAQKERWAKYHEKARKEVPQFVVEDLPTTA